MTRYILLSIYFVICLAAYNYWLNTEEIENQKCIKMKCPSPMKAVYSANIGPKYCHCEVLPQ